MKNIRFYCVLGVVLFAFHSANSQQLSVDQEMEFRRKAEQLISTYSEVSQITSDWATIDLNMLDQLRKTFVTSNKKSVFNDLLPLKVEGSKYLSPIEYTQFAQKNYPEGLDVRVDILDVTVLPKEVKKGNYVAIVKAKKTLRGLYGSKRIHKYSNTLYFYVNAVLIDGKVDGLGITMVADDKKHNQQQAGNRFAGLYVGVAGAYSYSMLASEELMQSDTWRPQMGNTFIPAFEVNYMITKGFGFGTGIRVGKYNPSLVLEGFQGEVTEGNFRDRDDDTYTPIYNIENLTELSSIQSFDIPLMMKLRSGSSGFGLYMDLGVVYSKYRSMSHSFDGTVTRSGYYDNYSVELRDIELYDYYTNKYFSSDEKYEIKTPSSSISAFLSTGFSIAVYKNVMLKLGISFNYGVTDIGYDQQGLDATTPKVDYYHTTGSRLGETLLHSASADFGLYYRILGK